MNPRIQELSDRITKITKTLDTDTLKSRKGELETLSLDESFWKDPNTAKKVMKEIGDIDGRLKSIDELTKEVANITEYSQLAEKEKDPATEAEIEVEINKISEKITKLETFLFLSGPYDKNDAMLSIHSGQGGTEANDWTEMLLRMYLRYSENQGWTTEVLHSVRGEEAGISTVTIKITGTYAFGLLKGEKGTHRLVRISPFNAQGLRQTSFAGVEVIPVLEESDEADIQIPEEEIDFKAVRSGGPGGQNVNKTSTAVMITHKPTGIVIHCSTQRSQHQNKETAMRMLKAKLFVLRQEEADKEMQKIKGEHKIAGWGNQIRNYILQPYKLVKDLRTKVESYNPTEVLDGKLDQFIEAELRLLSKLATGSSTE